SIQFLDNLTGYSLGNGNHGIIYKTTNGGTDWNLIHDFNPAGIFRDMSFVNQDTGWVCSFDSFDGGVFKTTDGGISWQQQINLGLGNPSKIFFVNKDTGWFSNSHRELYKTVNGGSNWGGVFTSAYNIVSIFFLNSKKGWIRGSADGNGNGISYTTDGGLNWNNSSGEIGGFDITFVNDSIGYAGGGSQPLRILKSTDRGRTWGYQNALATPDISISLLRNDSKMGWAGRDLLIKTTDGGGTIVNIENPDIEIPDNFTLYQNYPNPFNPKTAISYEIRNTSHIILKVYNVQGMEVGTLINERKNSGIYKLEFDGNNYISGVYFYKIEVYEEKLNIGSSETKKMLLIK
ncbi:MAG: T9SS type A sorting domain-containing protein, partial [bacterium]|nr:T9SS type A sorting domain-containing protein [bacterium]